MALPSIGFVVAAATGLVAGAAAGAVAAAAGLVAGAVAAGAVAPAATARGAARPDHRRRATDRSGGPRGVRRVGFAREFQDHDARRPDARRRGAERASAEGGGEAATCV